MKNLKNKKGFTLVELLAVIVILALIMAIAVVSMSGIMTSARQSTFKETAVQIINGVRQQLTLANELMPSDTDFALAKVDNASYQTAGSGADFFITREILEKGGDSAPLGGTYQFIVVPSASENNGKALKDFNDKYKKIGSVGVYRMIDNSKNTCGKKEEVGKSEGKSFVRVVYDGNNFIYYACITTGENYAYINLGSEAALLNSNELSMIQ